MPEQKTSKQKEHTVESLNKLITDKHTEIDKIKAEIIELEKELDQKIIETTAKKRSPYEEKKAWEAALAEERKQLVQKHGYMPIPGGKRKRDK
jgi:uncharacterized coiled-coil protein SlyX